MNAAFFTANTLVRADRDAAARREDRRDAAERDERS